MKKKWFVIAPVAILGILLFIALGGGIVMQLWNWLLPAIFGWRQITFWQAIGMLALCRILFGGFGRHGFRRSRSYTPEERARFRDAVRRRFGGGPSPCEGQEEGVS